MSDRKTDLDAVVVGAGFAGLYMLHKLRQLGLSARAFEAGADVGGTWYWNCYPGARCDVESLEYSFSWSDELQQEWQWSERYSPQSEILRYLQHVADRFDLRRDITFSTRVTGADFDADDSRWVVRTDGGETLRARFVITAAGCLSAGRVPEIPGLDQFTGRWYHTGNWPKEPVDFTDLRVAVVGTGSSGIQAIPAIARQAKSVTVLQRSPNFSIPAWNRPMTRAEQAAFKANYAEKRRIAKRTKSGILYEYPKRATFEVDPSERHAEYERRWMRGGPNFVQAFNDLFLDKAANDQAADFVRAKIRSIVADPRTAEMLSPTDHAIGTKRICVDTDYYSTYNQPHVKLVNLRETPIERIEGDGILLADGTRHEVDAIVFATGYDAVTGAIDNIAIRGRQGERLKDKWHAGPRTYLGLMSAGYPNLFMITGPGSPSILTNVVMSIEQHVEWIARCIETMQQRGDALVEAEVDAEDAWVDHLREIASKTLHFGAPSWYMGANIPGKPRVFLPYVGGLGTYTELCEKVVADGYRGFRFTPARRQARASA
ncbi:MAG TPA: NAD(P)/FAD-dependent oxidoreductase [Burkholderiaceae bacterium]|nr:NAD(P)/FAD-dependent oxidoreductase [Burkholderiaceae bacterium]